MFKMFLVTNAFLLPIKNIRKLLLLIIFFNDLFMLNIFFSQYYR